MEQAEVVIRRQAKVSTGRKQIREQSDKLVSNWIQDLRFLGHRRQRQSSTEPKHWLSLSSPFGSSLSQMHVSTPMYTCMGTDAHKHVSNSYVYEKKCRFACEDAQRSHLVPWHAHPDTTSLNLFLHFKTPGPSLCFFAILTHPKQQLILSYFK